MNISNGTLRWRNEMKCSKNAIQPQDLSGDLCTLNGRKTNNSSHMQDFLYNM